jgi:hypothetical protein
MQASYILTRTNGIHQWLFLIDVRLEIYRMFSKLLNRDIFEYLRQIWTECTDFFEDNTHDNVFDHQKASIDEHRYYRVCYLQKTIQLLHLKSGGDIQVFLWPIIYCTSYILTFPHFFKKLSIWKSFTIFKIKLIKYVRNIIRNNDSSSFSIYQGNIDRH